MTIRVAKSFNADCYLFITVRISEFIVHGLFRCTYSMVMSHGMGCMTRTEAGGDLGDLWMSSILTRHKVMKWWIRIVGRKAEIWCLFDFGVQKYTLYSYYISNFILSQPLPSTQPQQPVAFPCHQLLSLLQ